MKPNLHYLFFSLPPFTSFFVLWYAWQYVGKFLSYKLSNEKNQIERRERFLALEQQSFSFILAIGISVLMWASFDHGSLVNSSTLLVQSLFLTLYNITTSPM